MANASSDSLLLRIARKLLPERARSGIIAMQRKHRLQWAAHRRCRFRSP